jgi:hypothetical protein
MATKSTSRPTAARAVRTGILAFVILMIAAALATVAIIPYTLTLTGLGMPEGSIWRWLPSAIAQNLLLIAPVTALGLWLGPKVGLGAPLLSAWLEGRSGTERRHPDSLRTLLFSVVIGAAVGVVLVIGALAFAPSLPQELGQTPVPPWWQSLFASLSAGVTEELMLRLGVMTLLVWIGTKLVRRDSPSPGVVWTANAVAALAFGALHLPLAATLAPLTTMMVVRTLVLNGIAGMAFGWQYARVGLIAAMVTHASADIVLHVLTPLLAPTP